MTLGDVLLDTFLRQRGHHLNNDAVDVFSKIERLKLPFQTADINVLNFWNLKQNEEPELYALSKICFAIPPKR